MKFWSNVEKEYNDWFGEDGGESKEENQDESNMESDFKKMFSDITKDLKNVPKEDLIPGLSSIPAASDSEEDEGENGDEDATKALKIGDTKKKRNKKCKVDDKSYEVGERWKDPKTGKDMICILMNIPKEVQPKLAEADVTITKDEVKPAPKEVDLKPAKTGVQWAYTNKKPRGRGCPGYTEGEKPDQAGSEAEKDDTGEEQGEDSGGESRPLEDLGVLNKETENLEKYEAQEEQSGGEVGNSTGPSGKDSDTRESGGKESEENSEKLESENIEKGGPEENDNNGVDDDDSVSDTDTEEEKRKAAKESREADDSDYEEEENEDYKMKHPEIKVTKEDRESAIVYTEEQEKNTRSTDEKPEKEAETEKEEPKRSQATQETENGSLNANTATEGVPGIQEKGKTIFTKETTVTQKKLFKTSETIESVETEKKVD